LAEELPKPPESFPEGEVAGQQLAEEMVANGYHVVIIFGSTSSGKTLLLASLLAYMKTQPEAEAEIRLGEPFNVTVSKYGEWSHSQAEAFFNKSLQEFIRGTAHAATRVHSPFFIPVVVKPRGNAPAAKIAFLESNGEWYAPNPDSNTFFPELRGEIAGIFTSYSRGISFLHLAPVTQVEVRTHGTETRKGTDEELQQRADLALIGCFEAYKSVRVAKHKDRHLLLVTKWDAHAVPGDSNSDGGDVFVEPDLKLVNDVARKKYPQAYTAFKNLSLETAPAHAKQIMQYCSGVVSGRRVKRTDDEIDHMLQRYPRTLWNWIYRNATERELYPKPEPQAATLGQRINSLVHKFLNFIGAGSP
jgi:hypothetical protein